MLLAPQAVYSSAHLHIALQDLRQDERVMQLFGLVNSMLSAERSTAERDLSIARYAVIPLSPNSGLIGWVPNTDTLHALIR
jgi:FKBP12-rapamycin complex-associated protein